MRDKRHYLGRVPPQHRNPKFMAWLASNIKTLLDVQKVLYTFDDSFDLDNATGAQLDVLGDIVGRQRLLEFDPIDSPNPLLDDELYQILIKAKISMNHWDGTIPGVMALWETLFPDHTLVVQDNQDMTMSLFVGGPVSPLEMELMARGYLAPKPKGVRINYTHVSQSPEFFTEAHIGGILFPGISTTHLPRLMPDIEFETAADVAGVSFPAISTTRLPMREIKREFEGNVTTASSAWPLSRTALPNITPAGTVGLLQFDDTSIVLGWLELDNGQVVPLLLEFEEDE